MTRQAASDELPPQRGMGGQPTSPATVSGGAYSRAVRPGAGPSTRSPIPDQAEYEEEYGSEVEAMASTWDTTARVAHRMSQQARRDTTPELAIRSALHASGRRFRVSYPVPDLARCTIDIAFPRRHVAVFVDGCFWHDCPVHGSRPKANSHRWAAKLAANRARDRRVDEHLSDHGWTVVRVWEHEDVLSACTRILDSVSELEAAVRS